MNSQRNINRVPQRTIKSIKVLSHCDDDSTEARPTTRRSSIQSKVSSDPISMDKKFRVSSPQKQNKFYESNFQTQQGLQDSQQNSNRSRQSKQQSSEISYIESMLIKLTNKEQKQMETLNRLAWVPFQLQKSKQINKDLKMDLLELKQLMKSLLLERENKRMFSFYQDQ